MSATKFLVSRLRAFPLALTALTVVTMVGTGHYIVSRFEATLLHSYAEIAEIYADQFLEPYAKAYVARSEAAQPRLKEIEVALARRLDARSTIVLKIWLLDGQLVYSSASSQDLANHDPTELNEAILGQKVSHIETGADGKSGGPLPLPYVEVYLPIHDPATGTPIAVGEIYVDAREIIQDMASFERMVWLAMTTAMVAMLGMLAYSTRQSLDLQRRLTAEHALVNQNDLLRKQAEQARFDASQANEQVLNFVGAEIHDGPVQLLGLASLMGDGNEASGKSGLTASGLVRQAVAELRRIAAGLILPELERLDLLNVIKLAISRHQALTAAPVVLHVDPAARFPELDGPRRICMYRVLQEGLTNATRHGGADSPIAVSLKLDERFLFVEITSPVPAALVLASDNSGQGLGLQGMRRRLEAFGGSAQLEPSGERQILSVTLPFSQSGPSGA